MLAGYFTDQVADIVALDLTPPIFDLADRAARTRRRGRRIGWHSSRVRHRRHSPWNYAVSSPRRPNVAPRNLAESRRRSAL
jgi:hypothetical protein